jgi:hypothetical protein
MAQTYQLIENGPPFAPLRYGLLSAATVVDDLDPHWMLGIVTQYDVCGVPLTVTGGPCSATGIDKVPTVTGIGSSAAEPFSVYAWIDCSTVGHGNELEDLVAATEQLLTNGEDRAVGSVVWSGNAANGVIRPHLAENTAVMADAMGAETVQLQSAADVLTTGGPVSITDAIGMVEGALASCYGGEGVIHVPAQAVIHLSNVGVVTRQGNQLRTLLGNVVAVYASGNREGPTGSVAADGQGWIYGTGAVQVRRSPIVRLGRRPGDFVGRAKNDVVYVVERTYVVDWDCCHAAAQVSLPGAS